MPSLASRFASAGPTPFSPVTGRRSIVTRHQDAVDLDRGTARQCRRADGDACRVGLAEVLLHDSVRDGELAEVGEIDRYPHGRGEARARGLGDCGKVREGAPRLCLDAARDDFTGLRVEADLA